MSIEPKAIAARDFRRIARSIEYMAGHFDERPTLAGIAAVAGMSEYHYARTFRRWAGISPKQFLQRLSLGAAKASLAADASVLQAALDSGLSSAGRLHDLFVVLEAVTPGEFRTRGRGLSIRHGHADTPFGRARIATTTRGIAFLGFCDEDDDAPEGWDEFRRDWREADWVADDASARAAAYAVWSLAERHDGPLRLWVHGSNFQIQVWQALLRRARHLTVNYSDIAREIGRPSASRAVGQAVGANPVAWLIPCHHVLRANGALGGYRWGPERKRAMLAWEISRPAAAAG